MSHPLLRMLRPLLLIITITTLHLLLKPHFSHVLHILSSDSISYRLSYFTMSIGRPVNRRCPTAAALGGRKRLKRLKTEMSVYRIGERDRDGRKGGDGERERRGARGGDLEGERLGDG